MIERKCEITASFSDHFTSVGKHHARRKAAFSRDTGKRSWRDRRLADEGLRASQPRLLDAWPQPSRHAFPPARRAALRLSAGTSGRAGRLPAPDLFKQDH